MFAKSRSNSKQLDNNEFSRDWNPLSLLKKEKVDSSIALDASLVIIESNGTESQEQDTSSRSRNDAHVDDADIRPIYNEEPMAEVRSINPTEEGLRFGCRKKKDISEKQGFKEFWTDDHK
ncbi:hypothetical protein Tco_0235864 [Tanacetum coccineum]